MKNENSLPVRNPGALLLAVMLACLRLSAFGESRAPAPPASAVPAVGENSSASVYNLDDVWTDQDGKPARPGDFKGDVVVLAMFFTSCEYACPRIVADMQAIAARVPEELAPHVHYLLASFDTARDLPARLKLYAAAHTLPAERWTLLHGDEEAVQSLAAVLGVKYQKEANGNYGHSMQITVLDRRGEMVHQQEGLGSNPQEAVQAILRSAK